MFGPAGYLYVYLSYGIHHCANIVTGPTGEGQAVLIRAVEPMVGVEAMRLARPTARGDVDLTNGPGKLCAALGIDRTHDGISAISGEAAVTIDLNRADTGQIASGPRIGISVAKERPWRWYVLGNKWVSRPRPW